MSVSELILKQKQKQKTKNKFSTMLLVTLSCMITCAIGAEYTLPGACPKVMAFENIDFFKVSYVFTIISLDFNMYKCIRQFS